MVWNIIERLSNSSIRTKLAILIFTHVSIRILNTLRLVNDMNEHEIPGSNVIQSDAHITTGIYAIPIKIENSWISTNDSKEVLVVYSKDIYVKGFHLAEPELCKYMSKSDGIVIFVISAPKNFEARQAIRKTWGNYALTKNIPVAFLLGTSSERVQAKTLTESDLYGDIIVNNNLDSYANLTLKSISMLEWVTQYCENAKVIVKVDDDVFINLPKLIYFIRQKLQKQPFKTIYGKILHTMQPVRNISLKAFVSKTQYDKENYPPYVSGPFYMMTADCVKPLYDVSLSLPYIRANEDVYITGLLANLVHLKLVDVEALINHRLSLEKCVIVSIFSVHMVKPYGHTLLWKLLSLCKVYLEVISMVDKYKVIRNEANYLNQDGTIDS